MNNISPYTDLADEITITCLKAAFDDSIAPKTWEHPDDITDDAKLRLAVVVMLKYYMTEDDYIEWEESNEN